MHYPTVIYADQVVFIDSELIPHTPETVLTENVRALCEGKFVPFNAVVDPAIGMDDLKPDSVTCWTGEECFIVLFDSHEEKKAFTRAARIAYLAYQHSVFEDALLDLICN